MPSRHPTGFRRARASKFLLSALAVMPAAHGGERAVLSYYLPKTVIGVAVNQRLVSCPAARSEPIIVETSWTLKSRTVPDYGRPVHVDASTGFLAKRSVAVTLNPDGTLAAFNSSAEGQGGEVVASVLKLAGTLTPMMVGLPPLALPMGMVDRAAPKPRCTAAAVKLLDQHRMLSGQIADTEQLVRQGKAGTGAEDQLARDREALLSIEQELTLTAEAPPAFTAAIAGLQPGAVTMSGSAVIPRLDYSLWFVSSEHAAGIPGAKFGFGLDWAANKAAAAAVTGGSEAITTRGKQRPRDQAWDTRLVYRRPVPALLFVYPCSAAVGEGSACGEPADKDRAANAASDQLAFSLPQLSGDFSLPVGSAGIFGSRVVAAKFDASGSPIEISYGSDPGGTAIAGSIDAAGDAATSIHGARLTAMTHEIAVLEAKAKLKELKTPPAAADDGAAAAAGSY